MQRAAEVEPIVYIDAGGPDGDYAAFVVRLNNRIVDTFTIPAHMVGPTFSGSGSYDHAAAEQRRDKLHQYRELVTWVSHLRHRCHVSEPILARIMRLNTGWQPATRLRGIRRTSHEFDAFWGAWVPKGEFIRKNGRDAFNAIPHHLLVKRGRRRWVARHAVEERVWEFYQGKRQADYMVVADTPGFHGDNVVLRTVSWAEFVKLRGK